MLEFIFTPTEYRSERRSQGCRGDVLNVFSEEVPTFLHHSPATDNSGGLTILGCDTSSPYVYISEIKLPPSFYRRLTKAIAKNEWRPYFEEAAKRACAWLKELRKLCRLRENDAGLTGTSLQTSQGFCFGGFSVWKRNRLLFLFCRLKELRKSITWLTPSIPRSLRAPTFSL